MQADTRAAAPQRTIAIAVPIALLAVTYALWAVSDRLVIIGPFDRAAFGWTFVMPLAWLTPGVAGLVWAGLSRHDRWLAAVALGAILTAVAGALLASGTERIGCSPVTSWTDDLPRALIVGAVFAAGPAGGGLVAAWTAERLRGWLRAVAAIASGAVVGVISFFAALVSLAVLFVVGVSCAPAGV